MTDIPTHFPDLLSDHVASLRRLARSLVRCPDAAEDALQETWLRALATPRPPDGRLRAWLRTVLRNVVTSQHRQDSRRERREGRKAKDQLLASPLDLLERRETLRKVMAAVMKLDDNLQAVVFLRHFDELAPREIAARLELPIDVVYRRLKTAHERLRRDLEREFQNRESRWMGALTALFGLRAKTPWQSILKGTLVVTLNTKLSLSAAALVLAAIPVLLLATRKAPPIEVPAAAATADDPVEVVANTGDADTDREDVKPDAEPSGIAAATLEREPYLYTLQVHAFDRFDLPAKSIGVTLGPSLHHMNEAGTTDENGFLEIQWRAATPTMQIVIADAKRSGALRQLELAAGRPHHVALRSSSSPLHQHFVTLSFAPGIVNKTHPQMQFEDGIGRFITPALEMPAAGSGPKAATFAANGRFTVGQGDSPMIIKWDQPPTTDSESPSNNRIEGTVYDAQGQVAPSALVIAASPGNRRLVTKSNDQGNFAFDSVPNGTWTLRGGGGDRGIAHGEVVCDGGDATLRWDARLDRGHELRGRILDDDGQPLAGIIVTAFSETASDAFIDRTVTDASGYFAIPNVPRRAHNLRIQRQIEDAPKARVADWMHRDLWPMPAPIDIVIPSAQSSCGTLDCQIEGEPAQLADAVARLWQLETGMGIEATIAKNGKLTVKTLPPGDYRLEIGGRVIAWHESVSFRVDPGQSLDLGMIALVPTGAIELPEGVEAITFAQLHPNVVSQLGVRSVSRLDHLGDFELAPQLTVSGAVRSIDESKLAKIESAPLIRASSEPVLLTFNDEAPAAVPEPQSGPTQPPSDAIRLPIGRYLAITPNGSATATEFEVKPGQTVRVAIPVSGSTPDK